ncbi:hypothetical protein CMQ_3150 [Grosmannia clavigera kw1407]|uniref:Uncharacterized protein n=1 Tax=Grosmannia clavigera (strain kw1407 / UAMH 11150) TaxID=655863 RepID=F0XHZ2_GROCL|nr:uncharacterized protein CMQ_3150 [Grosmannia clavigera kw1407]EFX03221.1 hypothetical protein CMQ_3150 [Grosmannia clavigera kw1407]
MSDPLLEKRNCAIQRHNQDITHIIAAQVEFASLFSEAEADTIIWLQLSPAISKLTCDGLCYPQEWLLRYSSATLRSSGCDKFVKLLGNERYQRKTLNSLRSSGHDLPDGIRYVLDLGPSSDFDLRSQHLEALTLPKGIVQYSMLTYLTNKHQVPSAVAGGHDDACRCFEMRLDRRKKTAPAAAPAGDMMSQVGSETKEPDILDSRNCIWDLPLAAEFRIDDYCEVRHVANVIRLLLVLAERPLLLDSAARVYTICGLAKLFGANGNTSSLSRLRSLVHEWFLTKGNTIIIDTLPEECFRMAWNIKLPNVTRASYRILVAERALCDASDSSQPRTYQRQRTPFGRELSGLDDDLETLLDHASEALTRRIGELRAKLQSPDKLDLLDVPQYHRLRTIERAVAEAVPQTREIRAASTAIQRLADTYETILRTSLLHGRLGSLLRNGKSCLYTGALEVYVSQKAREYKSFAHVYEGLSEKQKLLTGVRWRVIGNGMARSLRGAATYLMDGMAKDANTALRRALVMDEGRADQVITNQLAILGVTIRGPYSTFQPQEPFQLEVIRNELRSERMIKTFSHLYDRYSFVPEFELAEDNPSPHLLLGLSENEFRFLPLWAGGQDDGSGGVFQDELPMAQLGPIGPGPAYHTGTTQVGTTADTMSTATLSVGELDAATDDASELKTEHTDSSFVLVQGVSRLAVQSEYRTTSSHESRAAHDGISTISGEPSAMTLDDSTCGSSLVDVAESADDDESDYVYDFEDDEEGFESFDEDGYDMDVQSDVTVVQYHDTAMGDFEGPSSAAKIGFVEEPDVLVGEM